MPLNNLNSILVDGTVFGDPTKIKTWSGERLSFFLDTDAGRLNIEASSKWDEFCKHGQKIRVLGMLSTEVNEVQGFSKELKFLKNNPDKYFHRIAGYNGPAVKGSDIIKMDLKKSGKIDIRHRILVEHIEDSNGNLNSIFLEGMIVGKPYAHDIFEDGGGMGFTIGNIRYFKNSTDSNDKVTSEFRIIARGDVPLLVSNCIKNAHEGRSVRIMGKILEKPFKFSDGGIRSYMFIAATHLEFAPEPAIEQKRHKSKQEGVGYGD
jgi:hypothetical protein